nr:hypothetical protein [Tanacetum cinerariifolium]
MILSGADNRPPMLDKDLYDSWKSRMELYMQNREHSRMILESVENGPLIWPTIKENGVTKTKKYVELSVAKKIQADYDMKETNIILQAWYKEKAISAEAQEARQILDEEKLAFLADPGVPNSQAVQTIIPNNVAFQTDDLDTYDSGCDDISNAKAVLMANISNYGSDVISEVPPSETYLNDMENQSYQNPFYLKKAQRIKPTLYAGIFISAKHVAMPVIDDVETLILEEESRLKISAKVKDPVAIKQKIPNKPIDYVKLNKLYEDFGRRFVQQQELSADEAFWYHMLNPSTKSSDALIIKIESPKEISKVSMVNKSLKKLKLHLANFDKVVKIRTTPNNRTGGDWGFEHTKAMFNNEIIPFLKSLKDIFNMFDRDLLNEIMEELLIYVQETCPNAIKLNEKKVVVTPKNKVKKFSRCCTKSVDLADSPMSTPIDQDAPSASIPSTQEQKHCLNISLDFEGSPKTPYFHDDPLLKSLREDSMLGLKGSLVLLKLLLLVMEEMDLETAQTTTIAKLPILKQVQTTTNDEGTSTTLIPDPVTIEEKVQKKNNLKARRLFSPPKLHLSNFSLEEFQQPDLKGYGPKTSNSVSKDISNEVKESPDALLVKELVLNDKLEKKIVFATVAKIEFVRPKQQENPVRKLVKHMTGNICYLFEYEEIDGGYVAFEGELKGGKITDTECVILSPDFKLLDESQVFLRVPRKNNMYNVDLKNVAPFGGNSLGGCLFGLGSAAIEDVGVLG